MCTFRKTPKAVLISQDPSPLKTGVQKNTTVAGIITEKEIIRIPEAMSRKSTNSNRRMI